MPDYQTHGESCRRKIGKACGEVHRWMDEPVKMMGMGHRVYWHDIKRTPKLAKKIWDRKYEQRLTDITGDEAMAACIDHIMLDKGVGDLPPVEKPRIALLPVGVFSLLFLIGLLFFALGWGAAGWLIAMSLWGGFLAVIALSAIDHPSDAPSVFGTCAGVGYFMYFLFVVFIYAVLLEPVGFGIGSFIGIGIPSFYAVLAVKTMLDLAKKAGGFKAMLDLKVGETMGSEETRRRIGYPSKEEKVYHCVTCGERISEREYEDNAGQCDHCVLEDTGTAMIYDLEE